MNKSITVSFPKIENMGDLLNQDIIEKCFQLKVISRRHFVSKLSGIGSGLGQYTYDENRLKNILKAVAGFFFPTAYVWGTGFIRYSDKKERFYKRNMKICAVRGQLTKARVENILGHAIDVPLGDPGILASCLLDHRPEKKYRVGIIAHYMEQDEPVFQDLLSRFPDSTFINVRMSPEKVIKHIAECEIILSSSLHGLIIADSLHIPNRHIVVSDKLMGDGYKFDDYYSAYGLPHVYTDMNSDCDISLDDVTAQYKITPQMVEKMQRELLSAFPSGKEDRLL